MSDEAETVLAVLATLARIVAGDDASLTVRRYDPDRRSLALVLATGADGPDAVLIWEFLAETLCRHGIRLAHVRIETSGS